MNKLAIALVIAVASIFSASNTASAQYPAGLFPGIGYPGFYGGFGAGFGSGYRTPPYFSVHPPVYYGARYARPYGISPFPALPQVSAPQGYKARLESEFIQPGSPTQRRSSNPCVSYSETLSVAARQRTAPGPIRSNPFVDAAASVDQMVNN
ncbi:hypothetical protein Q31b_29860 [Novipirellula aureliae]|uniref:Uncharacterized protein n=1 Tax=Novipirellula aureliae TaxID=2527966 RepID=A0A5C6E0Q2_9BACT|nr:hypothetical protein [Novipirellula aureliae]TWU41537.1 hypothetical protein Q31b_29860 [Novipirellula aureliae]